MDISRLNLLYKSTLHGLTSGSSSYLKSLSLNDSDRKLLREECQKVKKYNKERGLKDRKIEKYVDQDLKFLQSLMHSAAYKSSELSEYLSHELQDAITNDLDDVFLQKLAEFEGKFLNCMSVDVSAKYAQKEYQSILKDINNVKKYLKKKAQQYPTLKESIQTREKQLDRSIDKVKSLLDGMNIQYSPARSLRSLWSHFIAYYFGKKEDINEENDGVQKRDFTKQETKDHESLSSNPIKTNQSILSRIYHLIIGVGKEKNDKKEGKLVLEEIEVDAKKVLLDNPVVTEDEKEIFQEILKETQQAKQALNKDTTDTSKKKQKSEIIPEKTVQERSKGKEDVSAKKTTDTSKKKQKSEITPEKTVQEGSKGKEDIFAEKTKSQPERGNLSKLLGLFGKNHTDEISHTGHRTASGIQYHPSGLSNYSANCFINALINNMLVFLDEKDIEILEKENKTGRVIRHNFKKDTEYSKDDAAIVLNLQKDLINMWKARHKTPPEDISKYHRDFLFDLQIFANSKMDGAKIIRDDCRQPLRSIEQLLKDKENPRSNSPKFRAGDANEFLNAISQHIFSDEMKKNASIHLCEKVTLTLTDSQKEAFCIPEDKDMIVHNKQEGSYAMLFSGKNQMTEDLLEFQDKKDHFPEYLLSKKQLRQVQIDADIDLFCKADVERTYNITSETKKFFMQPQFVLENQQQKNEFTDILEKHAQYGLKIGVIEENDQQNGNNDGKQAIFKPCAIACHSGGHYYTALLDENGKVITEQNDSSVKKNINKTVTQYLGSGILYRAMPYQIVYKRVD